MEPAGRLTHVHILARDLDRSLRFYEAVVGFREAYRDIEGEDTLVFLHGADPEDVLTLHAGARGEVGGAPGLQHFGFRLADPSMLKPAIDAAVVNGGEMLGMAGWSPEDVAYVRDPDGYTIELDGRS